MVEGRRILTLDRPSPDTAAVPQRMERKAPAFVGSEPLTLAFDISKHTTLVSVSSGGRKSYQTPRSYEAGKDILAAARRDLLGDERPDAVVGSVAGKVSEDGERIEVAGALERYGYVGQRFAEDVADVMGQSQERVLVLSRDSAGANAERSVQPVRDRDGAYLRWNSNQGRLRGAVYTPEGWIIPHEERKGKSLVKLMDATYTTYRRANLDVAIVAFPESADEIREELADHMQTNWGLYAPTAPEIVEAHFREDSPLGGAEKAAKQLAEKLAGQDVKPPTVLYDGVNAQELKDRRSAR